jgi:hypothetical protein
MLIRYTGDNESELAEALQRLKPGSVFEPVKLEESVSFTQIWPDGQQTPGRWQIRLNDSLDAVTGAVFNTSQAGADVPLDDADRLLAEEE